MGGWLTEVQSCLMLLKASETASFRDFGPRMGCFEKSGVLLSPEGSSICEMVVIAGVRCRVKNPTM